MTDERLRNLIAAYTGLDVAAILDRAGVREPADALPKPGPIPSLTEREATDYAAAIDGMRGEERTDGDS